MKKNIVLLLIFFCVHNFIKSQVFIEGGLGYNFIYLSEAYGEWTGNKNLNFQIGKFKNERLMRTFTVSYMFGGKSLTEDNDIVVNPITGAEENQKYTRDLKRKTWGLGYERKRTFANTEFDDVWQYYNIINYQLFIGKISDETDYSRFKYKSVLQRDLTRTEIDIALDFGLGMARKFDVKSYCFAEIRITSTGLAAMGIYTKFGVRHFIR